MIDTSDRAAAQAIRDAQRRFPQISADGIVIGIRGSPFQEIVPEQVATAIEFLSMLAPTKTARMSSYQLKHVGEDWGKHHDGCWYLSNGALIVAALALDLAVEPCGPLWAASPNCLIGVSQKSVARVVMGNDFARRANRLTMSGIRAIVSV